MQDGSLMQHDLMQAGIAGAMVVLCGGAYALFLALRMLRRRTLDLVLASASYLLLLLSFFFLAQALHLGANWLWVFALLALAYLLSPHMIWKLTRAIHDEKNHGGSGHD